MLIQPESNGSMPEKEQRAIENLRQEILIAEQKVRQLQGAQRQINSEIQEALSTKAQVISVTETLNTSKTKLEKEIETLTYQVGILQKDRDDLLKQMEETRTKSKEMTKECQMKKDELDMAMDNLKTLQENHQQEVSKLIEDKKEHEIKVAKLLKALS